MYKEVLSSEPSECFKVNVQNIFFYHFQFYKNTDDNHYISFTHINQTNANAILDQKYINKWHFSKKHLMRRRIYWLYFNHEHMTRIIYLLASGVHHKNNLFTISGAHDKNILSTK